MKILVFTEGTITMQSSGIGIGREERVKQSKKNVASVNDFRGYIPNGRAVDKLNNWKSQGAEIYYLTSRTLPDEINDIKYVLSEYDFPDTKNLLSRNDGQEYKDVAEKLLPNILIEDDCESIGGESEMTYPHIRPDLKRKIKSIVIKEFGGIDDLPDTLDELEKYETN